MTAALSLHALMCLIAQEEESVSIMTYASASESGLVTTAQSILVDLSTIAQVKSICFLYQIDWPFRCGIMDAMGRGGDSWPFPMGVPPGMDVDVTT